MLLSEIKLIARERGIRTRNRRKEELIRAILEGERNGHGSGRRAHQPGDLQDFWYTDLRHS